MKIEFDSSRKILLIDYIDSDDITPVDQDDINAFIDFAKSVLRRRANTSVVVGIVEGTGLTESYLEHDCKPQYMGMFNSGAYRCTKCGLYFPTNKPNTRCSPPGDLGSDVTSEAVHAVSKDSPVASNAPIQAEAAALEELGKSGVIYPEHDWEGEVIDDGMRYHCIGCGRDITYTNSDKAVVRLPSGPCVVKRD